MTTRSRGLALLTSCAVLVAGCAHSMSANNAGGMPADTHMTPGMKMTPGMVMPDGSTMGPTAAPRMVSDSEPSAAAKMICSNEVRADITTVLALKTVSKPTARWANHVYTCTYRLPMGTFVLSVTESKNPAAAQSFAKGLRSATDGARNAAGLTTTAFSTPRGLVALVKDSDTLQVDATRLPQQFGAQHEKRTDFAYEIASDILGCWTED
jgi:hypothetical protein